MRFCDVEKRCACIFARLFSTIYKQAEGWLEGSKDDPNLALLRIDIDDAELWKTDIAATGLLKMIFCGTIKPGEEGSHAVVQTTAEDSRA